MIRQERRAGVETHLGVVTVPDGLALVGLLLSVIFPLAGLPISLIARRRLDEEGRDSYIANLGVQISGFLLVLLVLFAAVGFVLSVTLPSLAG